MKWNKLSQLGFVMVMFFAMNYAYGQHTVIPLAQFQQIRLNGALSLNDILDSDNMEQTLNNQLSITFTKECTTEPIIGGQSCDYKAPGFELSCFSSLFHWMDLTGTSFYLRYNNENITIGEDMSEMQPLFPTAYSKVDTFTNNETGVIYKRILLIIGVPASTSTLSFLYNSQTNKLEIIRLNDVVV